MLKKTIACVAMITLSSCYSISAVSADTETDLRQAVASMNDWLGGGSKARQWRELLDLNILDTQAALGHRADAAKLVQIQNKFEQKYDGLSHPVFRRVRRCIRAHVEQLHSNDTDISFLIERAKTSKARLSSHQVEEFRRDTVHSIEMLKRYYRHQLNSHDRALIFFEIKPDECIKYLEELELALPPERNAGQISSEIEAAENEMSIIQLQLDELNKQLDRINEWKQRIERPEGVDPPEPDDTNLSLATHTNLSQSIHDEEAIQNGQALLVNQLEQLKQSIERLKQELLDFEAAEKDRKKRFAESRKQVSELARRFASVGDSRMDSYYARALNAINTFRTAYISVGDPDSTDRIFDQRLQRLETSYQKYLADNDRRALAEMGNLTGWMESAGRGRNLVAAVRAQHSLPNLFFEISNQIVNQLATQETSEFRRVNEQVLNRLIRGLAYVEGLGTIQFVPDGDQARIAINFGGSISSDTYTRSGKLTAYAGAFAPFNIRRELFANVGGVFAGDTQGFVNLDSYFKCIDSNLKLVQKIAVKQFWKSKAAAEAITGERTRNELVGEFENQTDAQIKSGYDQFEKLNQRQIDRGKLLPATFVYTSSEHLIAVGHASTSFDLAANSQPQRFDSIPGDIRLKLHETTFSNYVSPLFAGRRMWNTQIAAEIAALTGRPFDSSELKREFNVEFESARPIQIEFDGNLLSTTIFGKFQRAGSRSRNALRILLKFKLVNRGNKLVLMPADKVRVELVDPTQKNIGTSSLVSFLESLGTNAFAEMQDNGPDIPLNLIPTEGLSPELKEVADELHLTQLRSENGWLYASWCHQPGAAFYSGVSDTPVINYPAAVDLSNNGSLDSPRESGAEGDLKLIDSE